MNVSAATTQLIQRAQLAYARGISSALAVVGVIGLLYTGFDHFSNVTGVGLLWVTLNPLTSLIHTCAGLVGIAMSTTVGSARRYLLLIGCLGVPWAITGYVVEGTLSDFFARTPGLVTVHLCVSVLALVLWAASTRRAALPG